GTTSIDMGDGGPPVQGYHGGSYHRFCMPDIPTWTPDEPTVGHPGGYTGDSGGFDPRSIPEPTLAPVDVYDPCGALDEHLADMRRRAQDVDALRKALQGADISATAADGILR